MQRSTGEIFNLTHDEMVKRFGENYDYEKLKKSGELIPVIATEKGYSNIAKLTEECPCGSKLTYERCCFLKMTKGQKKRYYKKIKKEFLLVHNEGEMKEQDYTTYYTDNTKENMCNSCHNNVPECHPTIIDFGDGYGNDNVIKCNCYSRKHPNSGIKLELASNSKV